MRNSPESAALAVEAVLRKNYERVTIFALGWLDRYQFNRWVRRLPNILTAVRSTAFIFAILGYLAVQSHHLVWAWLCFLILCLLAMSDVADGVLARRWGVTSTWGSAIDPVVDKLLVISSLVACWLLFPGWARWAAGLPFGIAIGLDVFGLMITRRRLTGDAPGATKYGKWKLNLQIYALGFAWVAVLVSWLQLPFVVLACLLVWVADYLARLKFSRPQS
ncbi:MAG TPA: CDP-alcohol phosphatidyltransferase family protein [Candidatus Polarisedimenticolaceae bacterium]|nr:CDP-alcohol phosphatidyltransferase family protein [Candidatus Polarisedimenticolaceae bacterium]